MVRIYLGAGTSLVGENGRSQIKSERVCVVFLYGNVLFDLLAFVLLVTSVFLPRTRLRKIF